MPWRNAPADRRRSDATYGAKWRKARDRHLKAARWRCEIKTPGVCIGAASEVNHKYGAANDPGHKHLEAACKPCHAQVTAQQGNDARRGRDGGDPGVQVRTAW
jgi:hypothetical protein